MRVISNLGGNFEHSIIFFSFSYNSLTNKVIRLENGFNVSAYPEVYFHLCLVSIVDGKTS